MRRSAGHTPPLPNPSPAGGEGLPKCASYSLQHALQVVRDLIVPETQDTKATGSQFGISNSVVVTACMLTAVDFNNQLPFQGNKIRDVKTERLLTLELHPQHTSCPQVSPQQLFLRRGTLPQGTCPLRTLLTRKPIHARSLKPSPLAGEGWEGGVSRRLTSSTGDPQ